MTVSGADTVQHDITLPAGALVTGSVTGSRGEALSAADGPVFRRSLQRASRLLWTRIGRRRLLLGKALTDMQGQFRMVVPAPGAP